MTSMTPRTLRRAGTFVLVGAALSLGLPTAQANSTFAVTRVSGADRFATAANLAASAFAGGAGDAVVARGDAFADALAGGYLAGRLGTGAPILLTNTGSVPQVTKDRLQSPSA